MDTLILYIGESVRFERARVTAALQELPGAYGFKENTIGSVIECRFDWGGDSTIIRLTEDEESISLSGSGDAAVQAALEIQARLSTPLRLVDTEYSFDLPISGIASIQELREQMRHGQ